MRLLLRFISEKVCCHEGTPESPGVPRRVPEPAAGARPERRRGDCGRPARGWGKKGGFLLIWQSKKRKRERGIEERKVPHYCHRSSGPGGAFSGSSVPSQAEAPGSGRAASPSAPGAARGTAGPGPVLPSPTRPGTAPRRAQPFPTPHPRKQMPGWAAAAPRAPAETGGRRPWPTDARGDPEPGTPGCCYLPPSSSVPPCPPGRCSAPVTAARRVCGAPGNSGALLETAESSSRLARGVLGCGCRGGAAPRTTTAAPGVGAAFTSGGTPLFSDPSGSKQPKGGREREKGGK